MTTNEERREFRNIAMTDKDKKKKEPAASSAAEAVRAEAVSWFEALNRGALSQEETGKLQAWLRADPAHAEAFRRLEQSWRDLAFLDDVEDFAGRKSARTQVERRPLLRRPIVWASALAASLVFIVVSSAFISSRPIVEPNVVRYATGTAETRTVELGDETKIYLSGESIVEVAYAPARRDVLLKRGAAYFEVARDADRPFVVMAENTQVTVIGTAFEVWRGPDAVRVSVGRGRVEVAPHRRENVPGAAPKVLSAGDQATSTLAGEISGIAEFDPEETLSWRRGRFIYTDVALNTVIADINRYRRSKVVLSDPSLGDMRVTAAFGADDTDGFLESFAQAEGFRLTTMRERTVLSRN